MIIDFPDRPIVRTEERADRRSVSLGEPRMVYCWSNEFSPCPKDLSTVDDISAFELIASDYNRLN